MKSARVPRVNLIMVMKSWKKGESGWSHVLDAFSCNEATVTTDGAEGPLGLCLFMKQNPSYRQLSKIVKQILAL